MPVSPPDKYRFTRTSALFCNGAVTRFEFPLLNKLVKHIVFIGSFRPIIKDGIDGLGGADAAQSRVKGCVEMLSR